MSQQLINAVNACKLTASWQTAAYKNKYGFTHYGADMVSTAGVTVLYACGSGTVLATGKDSVVGNVLCVIYPQATNRVTGKVQDVVLRYFHLASISVKKGDKVTTTTKLGNYGNTGSLKMPVHLHIEADTDTAHPLYSPTVKSSSLLTGTAGGANDRTMSNPLEWLYLKPSAPESQTYTTANDAYIRSEDRTPPPPALSAQPSDTERLRAENDKLNQTVIDLNFRISELEMKLRQIHNLSA